MTYKCSTMSPGKPIILGSKGQGHKAQKHCRRGSLHSCECWLFLVIWAAFPVFVYLPSWVPAVGRRSFVFATFIIDASANLEIAADASLQGGRSTRRAAVAAAVRSLTLQPAWPLLNGPVIDCCRDCAAVTSGSRRRVCD